MNKKKLSAVMIVLCALFLVRISNGSAENSNLISTNGFFAFQDGYVYFVTDYSSGLSSYRNDGRETGSPHSSDIWRVAETPGADAELLVSLPAPVIEGGVILSGGFYLMPAGNAVYMIRDLPMPDRRIHDVITRLDLRSGATENIADTNSCLYRDGELIYFYFNPRGSLKNEERGWKILNMQTGSLSSWTPEENRDAAGRRKFFTPNNGRFDSLLYRVNNTTQYVLDFKDGYVYFAGQDTDSGIVSIQRQPVAGGENEVLIPDTSVFSKLTLFFVQDSMAFLADDSSLSCMDLQAKTIIDTISINRVVASNPYCRFNVTDGQVYYLREDGLYRKTPGTENETLLVSGNMEDMTGLALGENCFYMLKKNGLVNSVWRIPFTASSLDEAEVLYRDPDKHFTEREENGWKFYEYESSVVIFDYTGNETYAMVPAQIHGKPVISVGLTSYNPDRPLQMLSVPEGVLRLGELCSSRLVRISLPRSLIRLHDWGYPRVFQTAEGSVIQYAGTRAEWQALDDASWSEYGEYLPEDTLYPLVLCSDGEWKDPARVPDN